MGTKTPTNKHKREIACEVCDMKFHTVQARNTHVSSKHPTTNRSDSSAGKAAAPSTPTSRVSKRLQLKKGSIEDRDQTQETKQKTEDSIQSQDATQKIDFECPKCPKVFPIYFQAVKHIQKKHGEDNIGKPISAESLNLLKPLQVITLTQNDPIANLKTPSEIGKFFCLGCDDQFPSITLFNRHLSSNHLENVDSMFFKTQEEFIQWKQKMEMQVKIKYLQLSKSHTVKYYQCNYVSPKNEYTKTFLCPSSINTKELRGGIQIHYRKDHCNHNAPKYVVPKEFANHITNKITKDPFDELLNKTPIIKENLYIKFSNLMSVITEEAKDADDDVLKTLLDSALKMQAVLIFSDDNAQESISKSMTDDQITNALEEKKTVRNKRKINSVVIATDPKKAKVNDDSREIVSKENNNAKIDPKKAKVNDDSKEIISKENNKAKIKDEVKKVTVSKENNNESPRTRLRPPSIMISPSFNDTYKQFLGVGEKDTKSKNRITKRKEVVKTKIGQFSPKKKSSIEGDKSPPNILKPSRTNTSFFPKDVKYEVREQENDCNILILKI